MTLTSTPRNVTFSSCSFEHLGAVYALGVDVSLIST
jgi:hypothetical protein